MTIDRPFMFYANLYIKFVQFFGICPFHIKNGQAYQPKCSQIFLFITIINLSVHLLHFIHSLLWMKLWLFDGDIILIYIDFFSPLILRIIAIVIIIENYLKRKKNMEILNLINSLNFLLTKKLKMKNNLKKLKIFIWCFYLFIFLELLMIVITLCTRSESALTYYTLLYTICFITKNFQFKLSLIYIYSLMFNIYTNDERLFTKNTL